MKISAGLILTLVLWLASCGRGLAQVPEWEKLQEEARALSIDDRLHHLGRFDFTEGQPAVVIVSNAGADGYVVIDAVQWLLK